MADYRALVHACLHAIVKAAWLLFFFLGPLRDEAISMHKIQLDPTEIIAIPYTLQRLVIYVASIVVAALVHHHHPNNKNSLANVLRMLRHLGILTAWTVAVFVLCGASPTENVLHTVLASISFVTLGWFDTPALYGNYSHTTPPTTTQETAIKKSPLMGSSSMPLIDVWHQRLRGRHQDWMTTAQRQQLFLERCVFFSCIVCTIPCQILLLYDRGWQVQRWPCPVIIGSTIGWIVGVLLGAAHISLHQFNPTRFADKKLEDCPGVESTKDSHLPEAVDFVASDRHS